MDTTSVFPSDVRSVTAKRLGEHTGNAQSRDRWTTANTISLFDKGTARWGPNTSRDQYSNCASNGVEVSL